MMRSTTQADYTARLLRVQQAIEEHIDATIDPAELAGIAHFSLHHFHRIFRGQLGESVMEHVRRLRLERAARRLRDAPSDILQVALEARYDSHEAFTRAFSDHFGTTPSGFRAEPTRWQRPWHPADPSTPACTVEVREHAPVRIAFMRHHGSYSDVGATWQRLVEWAAAQEWPMIGALYGICPDDPAITPERSLRFDAGVVIPDDRWSARNHPVAVTVIPGGTYATAVHRGSYFKLADTYLELIGRWFPQSGYEPAPDAVVEHYLNDPSITPEDDLLTEVRVRIADH